MSWEGFALTVMVSEYFAHTQATVGFRFEAAQGVGNYRIGISEGHS